MYACLERQENLSCLITAVHVQEEAMMSLEMADRSVVAQVCAAVEKSIGTNVSVAALQECMAQDAILRVRFVKVGLLFG